MAMTGPNETPTMYKAVADSETGMDLISAPDRLSGDMVRYLIAHNMLPDAELNHLSTDNLRPDSQRQTGSI